MVDFVILKNSLTTPILSQASTQFSRARTLYILHISVYIFFSEKREKLLVADIFLDITSIQNALQSQQQIHSPLMRFTVLWITCNIVFSLIVVVWILYELFPYNFIKYKLLKLSRLEAPLLFHYLALFGTIVWKHISNSSFCLLFLTK